MIRLENIVYCITIKEYKMHIKFTIVNQWTIFSSIYTNTNTDTSVLCPDPQKKVRNNLSIDFSSFTTFN